MSNPRFDVRLDPDGLAEYQRLDHALAVIVDKALERLEERADEIGTPVQNRYATKLHGGKEIKLRDAGLCIVFRVTDHTVEVLRVVYILAIERRDGDVVFRLADRRLRAFKRQHDPNRFLANRPRWRGKGPCQ
jgi:mRNA interferase RelE/StbE